MRAALLAGLTGACAVGWVGCGEGTKTASRPSSAVHTTTTRTTGTTGTTGAAPSPAPPATPPKPVPRFPVVSAPTNVSGAWQLVARVREQPAVWAAQRGGVTLMRFDQRYVRLVLHAGSSEPGGEGWVHGDQIKGSEVHRVIAGFNGGFKLSYGSVGYMEGGRVAVALAAGLASIITYSDGTTQIGAWDEGVPARGRPLSSVRQNLHLLIDHGVMADNVEFCVQDCWGSTLGGGTEVARSALGITADGELVWAAGESLSPAALAHALAAAGAQRAIELDINPYWVAGYLYIHRPSGPEAVPVIPGQHGIAGELLEPDPRDFFTIVSR